MGCDVSEAINSSVALNRPERSFGATTDSRASHSTEGSARVHNSVVFMFPKMPTGSNLGVACFIQLLREPFKERPGASGTKLLHPDSGFEVLRQHGILLSRKERCQDNAESPGIRRAWE